MPETGTYYVPGPHLDDAEADRLHKAGPVAFIFFTREGMDMMDPKIMGLGLVHGTIFAFLLAMLLAKAGPAVGSYAAAVKFGLLVGVIAGLFIHFGDAIWWRVAWDWKFHTFLYTVTAFLVTGAVLMKFVGRKA